MFRTDPLSIIRSISTLYTQQLVFVMLVMLTVCKRVQDVCLLLCIVLRLLKMDS